MEFRWNAWNLGHATRHGISVAEIEAIIEGARPPYPESRGDAKWRAVGRGQGGRFVQAVYVIDPDGTIFPIHARLLTPAEVRRYRRRRR